ncbi:LysR family transcriptional regulator [Amantichitinum ursilacus]|uniref:HTH-type transcriptional regulator CynR n=1 Tax=Amantichitinum ursilacus TaxID=857265 RepID=A0A0N0GLE3_9NEIS|nr:LysR family transcriptional regulator [Amantichitinum ursilacus]KPC49791.1 HTH-type transcriptional regulator CynR [Amantichitinum ursilacus]
MNWQDIQYFCAYARSGSLSAAAREFGVDHVTVGRRIAALEQALALRLVDRLPRSTVLTDAGRAFAQQAAGMADQAQALTRQARNLQANSRATVRISAPPAVASWLLAPHVAPFCLQQPEIKLVLSGVAATVALDRGEADIAVRMTRPNEPDLIAQRVGMMRFALYSHADYASTPVEQWQFIGYDAALDNTTQQRWLHQIAQGKALVFEASDLSSQMAAVRGGLGVAALPRFVGDSDPALQRLPAPVAAPEREMWLVTYPDLYRAAPIRAVMAMLAHAVGQACPLD